MDSHTRFVPVGEKLPCNYCHTGLVPSSHSTICVTSLYQFNPFIANHVEGKYGVESSLAELQKTALLCEADALCKVVFTCCKSSLPRRSSSAVSGGSREGREVGFFGRHFPLVFYIQWKWGRGKELITLWYYCGFTPLQIVYPITTSGWGWYNLQLCSKELLS